MSALGCSVPALRLYVAQQFRRGMTWENWGSVWHLDHIKALVLFDLSDPVQFAAAAHYTNMQPLFIADHNKKTTEDRRKARALRALVAR